MVSNLLNLANTVQAANLVGHNYKESKKKKPDLVKMGVSNIVGVSLIKANADIIGSL